MHSMKASVLISQFPTYLTFVLILSLSVSGRGVCVDTFSSSSKDNLGISSENGRSWWSFDENLTYSMKYFTQSYFQKYSVLDDLDFEIFLKELFCTSSFHEGHGHTQFSTLPFPTVQRYLSGEGSHRHLVYSIKFNSTSDPCFHHCNKLAIIEKLPNGVFADPFELHHLVQRGVFTSASVLGDTNLELPSALSNRSTVEIHIDIDHHILSEHTKDAHILVDLPIHSRYPPLNEEGYATVEMRMSNMLMHCEKEEPGDPSWVLIELDSRSSLTDLIWFIPSGNHLHAKVVWAFTFLSAFVSALSLILVSISHASWTHESEHKK